MKLYIIIFIAAALFTIQAQAALNCYTDAYGNTSCTGSDGYQSETYEDSYGNSTTRDNQGNTWNCYTDDYGNTSCN
jgi:hypothetical protein